MERFVALQNISRFEKLLREEADPKERRILAAMLREERIRLAEAEARCSASPSCPSLAVDQAAAVDRGTC